MEITANSPAVSFYVIVTGLFRYKENSIDQDRLFNEYFSWKHRIFGGNYRQTFDYLDQSYYDSYINNMFPEIGQKGYCDNKLNPGFLNHLTLRKCIESPGCYSDLTLKIKDSEIGFEMEYADLFLFPYDIGFFSMKFILREKEQIPMEVISEFTNRIRHLSTEISINGRPVTMKKFAEEHILHVLDQGEDWDAYNPQFKSYIMIDLAREYPQEELERILYDIGNVSVIGSAKGAGIFAPAEEYYREQMEKNRITIFRNWSALSLFDTFTRISMSFPDKFKSWEYDYFNIYIHCLYIKFFMYLTNTEISNVTTVSKRTEQLRDNFIEFINDYHHSHISYKFLPDLVQDKLLYSLEIHSEADRMETKVQRINEHFHEKRQKNMNFVLILITLLGVFSLIYDLSNWSVNMGVPGVYPWGSLGGGLMLVSVLIVVIMKKRK